MIRTVTDRPAGVRPVEASEPLVRRARRGGEALGRLFERHYEEIVTYCTFNAYNGRTAEDLTSEVFLRVARDIRNLDNDTDAGFRIWLFQIATRVVNAHLTKAARRNAPHGAYVSGDACDGAERLGRASGRAPLSACE